MAIVFDFLRSHLIEVFIDLFFFILCLFLAYLRKRLKDKYLLSDELRAFYECLPDFISEANLFFPESKSGVKKFDYVVGLVSKRYPHIDLSTIRDGVNAILFSDRKGGDSIETVKSQEKEGSQDFCENSEEAKSFESSSTSNERRYTFMR